MAIDRKKFIENLKKEIGLLTKLRDEADAALGRANSRLKDLEEGKPIESVFPPKR